MNEITWVTYGVCEKPIISEDLKRRIEEAEIISNYMENVKSYYETRKRRFKI